MSAQIGAVAASIKQPRMIRIYGPASTYSVSNGALMIMQTNLKDALVKEFPNTPVVDMRNAELATLKAERYLKQSKQPVEEDIPAPGDG